LGCVGPKMPSETPTPKNSEDRVGPKIFGVFRSWIAWAPKFSEFCGVFRSWAFWRQPRPDEHSQGLTNTAKDSRIQRRTDEYSDVLTNYLQKPNDCGKNEIQTQDPLPTTNFHVKPSPHPLLEHQLELHTSFPN